MYSKYGECKLTTPLQYAAIAQLVERIHGKDEVSGSNPDRGSTLDFSAIWSPSRAPFCMAVLNVSNSDYTGMVYAKRKGASDPSALPSMACPHRRHGPELHSLPKKGLCFVVKIFQTQNKLRYRSLFTAHLLLFIRFISLNHANNIHTGECPDKCVCQKSDKSNA